MKSRQIMRESKPLLTWSLTLLGVVIGVVLGIIEGNGLILCAFSGAFAGGLVYGAIILIQAIRTREDFFVTLDEERRANRRREAAHSPLQRVQQVVQEERLRRPPEPL